MKVNNNISVYNAAKPVNAAKNTSFKGVGSWLGNLNKDAMAYLERGGFFAEFCLLDVCGLGLPRVYQGFNRNKQELGHLNYQAGAEEFLREFITGPSLFLIPIGAVILAGRLLGRGTQIRKNLLPHFSNTFKALGERFSRSENSVAQRAFAEGVFDSLFVNNAKRIEHAAGTIVKPIGEFKERFVTLLTEGIGTSAKKADKTRMGQFVDLIADINAAHFGNENTKAIVLATKAGTDIKTTLTTSASDLYLDARRYMEDVIPSARLSFDDLAAKGTSITKEVYDKTIDAITKVRENGRKLLCVGGTAALAAFLSIIPIIYQRSKKNPALNGLEESQEVKKSA